MWVKRLICACSACISCGWRWPVLSTAMPPAKSM
ncbi:Uncharacterised protein [Bordetella pertussis]|nr:Uncharacterised protein [Bordetella pertussis]